MSSKVEATQPAQQEEMTPQGTPVDQWDEDSSYSIVILGASGDLAKKKIYPVLWYVELHGDGVFHFFRKVQSHSDCLS